MDTLLEHLDGPTIVILIVVIFIGQYVESILRRRHRLELAIIQRENFYANLDKQKRLDEQKLNDEIQAIKGEIQELEKELGEDNPDLHRSAKTSSIRRKNTFKSTGLNTVIPQHSQTKAAPKPLGKFKDLYKTEDKLANILESKGKIIKEIENLKRERDTLETIEREIDEVSSRIDGKDLHCGTIGEKIRHLERECSSLIAQLDNAKTNHVVPAKESDLRESIVNFLKENEQEYTIEFLNKTYDRLLELQVKYTNANLSDLDTPADYEKEELDLKLKQNRARKLLDQQTTLYKEELKSFKETRIEYMFKILGNQSFLDGLKERNKILEEIIQTRTKENALGNSDHLADDVVDDVAL